MSTWHQDSNPVPLWDKSRWTVVTDPPGKPMSVMRFESQEEAQRYIARLEERGEFHSYILPPGGF